MFNENMKKIVARMYEKNPQTIARLSEEVTLGRKEVHDALYELKEVGAVYRHQGWRLNRTFLSFLSSAKRKGYVSKRAFDLGKIRFLQYKGLVGLMDARLAGHRVDYPQFCLTEQGEGVAKAMREAIPHAY